MIKRPISTTAEARLRELAFLSADDVLTALDSRRTGLSAEEADRVREEHGSNEVSHAKDDGVLGRLASSFADPFTAILILIAAISLLTDVVFAAPGERDPWTTVIIAAMVLISGTLKFVQETRGGNAAAALAGMIRTTCSVERAGEGRIEIPLADVVPGDIVWLSAGDMVPADLRILSARNLFVSQSALTGESQPVEKLASCGADHDDAGQAADPAAGPAGSRAAITDLPTLAFMGSAVISGSGVGVVALTGASTLFGGMAATLSGPDKPTAFDQGISDTSRLLVRFMAVTAPIVLLVNGLTKGSWLDAAMFALSVAVGLTPEMLPMLVTTCLAKGAADLARSKVIVKKLDAIQNLGSMDVLCTDKTGTLTQDCVILERHLDVDGRADNRVLAYAFLNSFFETGMRNLVDSAIISRASALCGSERDVRPDGTRGPTADELAARYHAVDEIPFDFDRRRVSVMVAENEPGADGRIHARLIAKGALEEVLDVCGFVELDGRVEPLTAERAAMVRERGSYLAAKGMRVLAVARLDDPAPVGQLSAEDERGMILIGYLAFLDPPKPSAGKAVAALAAHGVATKVLTGDSALVAQQVCETIGIPATRALTGADIEDMDDAELRQRVEDVCIFAKLAPAQKARVVAALQANGHVVGYMGDGMNDAGAMRESDCGISVDSAVDTAKESADIILLEKDLMVLEHGIEEGRRTFANTMKYVRMTASSNFGNVFSVLVASILLPFLPMTAVQLLLLNLINDICSIALPWDAVDDGLVREPRRWDAGELGRYMRWFGPASSVIDLATFALLFWIVCPAVAGGPWGTLDAASRELFVAVFQAGWFVESMWTQVAVQHLLRTDRLPLVESRASWQVTASGLAAGVVATLIPLSPLAAPLGFAPYPASYLGILALVLAGFCVLILLVKRLYARTGKGAQGQAGGRAMMPEGSSRSGRG